MTTTPLQIEQDTPLCLWDLIKETAVFLWKDWPREMDVSRYSRGERQQFTLVGPCPHCLRDAVFMQITSAHTESSNRAYCLLWIAGMQCQGCNKHILGIVRDDSDTVRYVSHYPLGKPDDSVDEDVPKHIAADFKEALRCRWVDAYNATAEMCRRAVEASCIELGAPKKEKWLDDKIDWLEAQRKITPLLKEVAHKIRLGGNRAAHPPHVDHKAHTAPQTDPNAPVEEDVEPPISKEHADAIITFTREFFHHVYVVPKQLDKYDFSRPKRAVIVAPGATKKGP